jgi:hypothetical protein
MRASGDNGHSRRLGNLIRRLGSDHDGEVLATVAAIRRTLSCAGRSLHDLADMVESNGAALVAETAEWRRDIKELLRQREHLTPWELQFVRTVSRYRSPPSAKQLDVIARIWLRLHGEAAHAA